MSELVGAATGLRAKSAAQRVELTGKVKTPATAANGPGAWPKLIGVPTMNKSMPPTPDSAGVRHA